MIVKTPFLAGVRTMRSERQNILALWKDDVKRILQFLSEIPIII